MPALVEPNAPIAGGTSNRIGGPASRIAGEALIIEAFARSHGAHGEELPGFDAWLSRTHGVPEADGVEAKAALIALFEGERARIAERLAGEIDKAEKKTLKSFDRAYEVGLRLLARAPEDDAVKLATLVRTAKECLYTVIAKLVRDQVGSRHNVVGILAVGRRAIAPWTYRIQMSDPAAVPGRGNLEAKNLVDPNDPTRFVTAEEMSAMTTAQIASLDISPDHPMWRTEAYRKAHPNAYAELEEWLDGAVTKEIQKAGFAGPYSFAKASRVLFFDGLRDAATSPKIAVKDGYGQELGLKWGEECAIEPVANRLLMKLGIRFTDVADNRVGGDSPYLILGAAAEQGTPTTKEDLEKALLGSAYQFNVTPHIRTAEVIDETNVDRILAAMPEELRAKHPKESLLGRTALTFKESMTEAKHDVFGRGGPVPLHSRTALSDRVRRGMQIAYLWLHSKDNKEDNHRYSFPKGFEGAEGRGAVSFVHDTGSTLGGMTRAGMINELHVDRRFLHRTLLGGDLVSSEFQLYRSSAWDAETMADVLWMAKKVASLSQDDIRECVEASKWPDFMKATLVYRLAKRRDMIAKEFGLATQDPAGAPPTIVVPLSTRADREAAAAHYGLDVEAIESSMRDGGVLGRRFDDVLVRDGTIAEADDTVLIGLLRDAYYPTGLDHRTNRREDGQPYRRVRFDG